MTRRKFIMTEKDKEQIYIYPGSTKQEIYDIENDIADPDDYIEKLMEEYQPFEGKVVVDIGAGGGYHATKYAKKAHHVFTVEPSPDMLKQLYNRIARNEGHNISVLATHAEDIPLKDECADIIHSRFAYFFGPENEYIRPCLPGIQEAKRILKPNGVFFIIDNTWDSGQFADFLCLTNKVDGNEVQRKNEEFYKEQGFQHRIVKSEWRAADRESLAKVIEMEFGDFNVNRIMEMVEGCTIEYHYSVYIYQK